MAPRDLAFRVFVSSTFSDLIAERNALQEYVFPRLRELCQKNGARFQAIDLRWGVSEEASLDQQTMNICLQELKRCQEFTPRPNFIVLLGDRYGWRPLPPQILATHQQVEWVTDAATGKAEPGFDRGATRILPRRPNDEQVDVTVFSAGAGGRGAKQPDFAGAEVAYQRFDRLINFLPLDLHTSADYHPWARCASAQWALTPPGAGSTESH